jgi:hypothetical protein
MLESTYYLFDFSKQEFSTIKGKQQCGKHKASWKCRESSSLLRELANTADGT